MRLAIVIALSVFYLVFSYVFANSYLHNGKVISTEREAYKMSLYKGYWVFISVVIFGGVIYSLNFIFSTQLVDQVRLLTILCVVTASAWVDFNKDIIPNILLIIGLVARIIIGIWEAVTNREDFIEAIKDYAIGAGVLFLFFMFILLVFHGICMGDVKLFTLIGLYQGLWGAMTSVFCSFVMTFIISVILLIFKKKGLKDTIPMAPGIWLGTGLAIFLAGL